MRLSLEICFEQILKDFVLVQREGNKPSIQREEQFIMKKIAWILVATLILSFFLLSSCSQNKEGVVTLYSCMEESRENAMLADLGEKFPNITFELEHYSTGNLGAKILAESTDTKGDILVGLQSASLETVKDSLADVSGVTTATYAHPQLNPSHGKYWVWEKYDGAFVINTDAMMRLGFDEPKTYTDLLNPAYKGQIVMPSAKMSGTGYMFFNNWYNMWGELEAFDYLDQLQVNVLQFVSSGSNVPELLLSEEAAIGLVDLMNVYRRIADGAPLKIIIPETGAPFNTTGTAIISGKEENLGVLDVYTYLMREYVVRDNSNFSPGGVFSEQARNIEGYPQDIPIADMSTITDEALKNVLVEKWKY